MAEPQFIPAQGPGAIIAASDAGLNTSLSLMDRAEVSRVRAEQIRASQEQRAQEAIMFPVRVKQAEANIKKLNADIEGMARAESMRAAVADIVPVARARFDDIMVAASPEERARLALQWDAEFGHLENVADFAPEIQGKRGIISKMVEESISRRDVQLRLDAELLKIDARGEVAVETAKVSGKGEDRLQRLLRLRDQANDSGDIETAKIYEDAITKANRVQMPYSDADRIQQLMEEARLAEAEGDTELGALLRQRATTLSRGRGSEKKPSGLDALFGDTAPAAQPAPATSAATTTPPAIPSTINF